MKGMGMEWQPIATAPRDGTSVLLYVPDMRQPVCVGRWFETETREFGEVTHESKSWLIQDFALRMFGRAPEPTHWMPLPAAPASAAEDEALQTRVISAPAEPLQSAPAAETPIPAEGG